MAINIERQKAFGEAFKNYPSILEQFAERNVSFTTPDGTPFKPADPHKTKLSVMELLMAQFITRLFQTRARNSPSKLMREFADFTVARYKQLTLKNIGALVMVADSRYQSALNHIESGMAELIFEGLMREAEIDEVAAENGKTNSQWDEADFWHDIMGALGTYYRKAHHPRWWTVTQYMFHDHKKEFKEALEDENKVALEAESASNSASAEAGTVGGDAGNTRH